MRKMQVNEQVKSERQWNSGNNGKQKSKGGNGQESDGTDEVQVQKYKTHAYKTPKTACVKTIMLKHPTKQ